MPPFVRLVLIIAVIAVVVVIYGRVVGRRDKERGLADLSPRARDAITDEIQAGHTINAVKLYRDATGAPLTDAKRAIDSWFVVGQGVRETSSVSRPPRGGRLTDEARERISTMVRDGRREDAMALYAEVTGASDSEAQAIIRSWDPEQNY